MLENKTDKMFFVQCKTRASHTFWDVETRIAHGAHERHREAEQLRKGAFNVILGKQLLLEKRLVGLRDHNFERAEVRSRFTKSQSSK